MRKFIFISLVFQLLFTGNSFAQSKECLVLKQGPKVCGYISNQIPGKQFIIQTEDDITLPYDVSSIAKIERTPRDSELLVGLVDVIETRGGKTYKGQIICKELGKSFVILTDQGTETINIKDILLERKEKLHPDSTLISQAEFLNIIVTDREERKGVITMQHYGNDSVARYLCLTDENNNEHHFLNKDIRQIHYVRNKDYKEAKVFRVVPGHMYFNEIAVESIKVSPLKKGVLTIDENDVKNAKEIKVKNGILTVATDDTPDNRQYILMKLRKIQVNKQEIYAFTYEQAQKDKETYDTTCQNGTKAEWTYTVKEGPYALLIPGSDKVYVVNIVK